MAQANIIFPDLRKCGFRNIKTPAQPEVAIDQYISAFNIKYLFIDEIQNVSGFKSLIEKYILKEVMLFMLIGVKSAGRLLFSAEVYPLLIKLLLIVWKITSY